MDETLSIGAEDLLESDVRKRCGPDRIIERSIPRSLMMMCSFSQDHLRFPSSERVSFGAESTVGMELVHLFSRFRATSLTMSDSRRKRSLEMGVNVDPPDVRRITGFKNVPEEHQLVEGDVTKPANGGDLADAR